MTLSSFKLSVSALLCAIWGLSTTDVGAQTDSTSTRKYRFGFSTGINHTVPELTRTTDNSGISSSVVATGTEGLTGMEIGLLCEWLPLERLYMRIQPGITLLDYKVSFTDSDDLSVFYQAESFHFTLPVFVILKSKKLTAKPIVGGGVAILSDLGQNPMQQQDFIRLEGLVGVERKLPYFTIGGEFRYSCGLDGLSFGTNHAYSRIMEGMNLHSFTFSLLFKG